MREMTARMLLASDRAAGDVLVDSITRWLEDDPGRRAEHEARYRIQNRELRRETAEAMARVAEIDAMIEARRAARPTPPPITDEYRRQEERAFLDLLRKGRRRGVR